MSAIAQNLFGGALLRASLEGTEFVAGRSHYINKLSDGMEKDFTRGQFGERYPNFLTFEPRTREYLLSYSETAIRYKLLAWRMAKVLSADNPLFLDPIYQKCFYNALDSKCQKMKFGCVITHGDKVVYQGCNRTIEPLKSLCDPTCIRFSITSRTESMLGACGHAEEGMWEVIHRGIPIHECELYVAGLHANNLPWLKKQAEHTCLRCSVQMHNAKIKQVYVPVIDRWQGITTEQALQTALVYATKEKKV